MRVYEELFIVRPDATDEEIDPLVEQLRGIITSGGGNVDKVDKWGVRKLAYRVQKRNEGFYVLVQFGAGPEAVKEIERRLRVSDLVLKFKQQGRGGEVDVVAGGVTIGDVVVGSGNTLRAIEMVGSGGPIGSKGCRCSTFRSSPST